MTASAAAAVSLRPITNADSSLVLEIFASTRAAELEHLPLSDEQKLAFIAQQSAAQERYYRSVMPDASYDIIEVGGAPIGRLYVDRSGEPIHLVDIALLPSHRNRGIGSRLIGELLVEAATHNRPVQLEVANENPANRLYSRLGFQPIDVEGFHVTYAWSPSAEGQLSS